MIAIRVGLMATLVAAAQTAGTSKATTQLEFVTIAPGTFMMGCLETDKDCIEDEVPRHKVQLTKSFELGKYEVTQAQWDAVMGAGKNPSQIKGATLPVDSVDKDEIHSFLDKLNARRDGYKYRLPTEAEWEY